MSAALSHRHPLLLLPAAAFLAALGAASAAPAAVSVTPTPAPVASVTATPPPGAQPVTTVVAYFDAPATDPFQLDGSVTVWALAPGYPGGAGQAVQCSRAASAPGDTLLNLVAVPPQDLSAAALQGLVFDASAASVAGEQVSLTVNTAGGSFSFPFATSLTWTTYVVYFPGQPFAPQFLADPPGSPSWAAASGDVSSISLQSVAGGPVDVLVDQLRWLGGAPTPTPTSTPVPPTTATPTPWPDPSPRLTPSLAPPPGGSSTYAYPQPASGRVNFALQLGQPADVEIQVINAGGAPAATLSGHLNRGLGSLPLNLGGFAPGVYYYRVVLHQEDGGTGSLPTRPFMVVP
ncbi:MAG TPA: hypothetical protein VK842_03210 [bacterium]|nr:hypothetical protein [bacterium]